MVIYNTDLKEGDKVYWYKHHKDEYTIHSGLVTELYYEDPSVEYPDVHTNQGYHVGQDFFWSKEDIITYLTRLYTFKLDIYVKNLKQLGEIE